MVMDTQPATMTVMTLIHSIHRLTLMVMEYQLVKATVTTLIHP